MATEEDENFLRIFLIHKNVMKESLLFLFSKGCSKQPNEKLKDYLQNPPNDMSTTEYKKIFNQDQRKTLDADPTGKTYDITLLSNSVSIEKVCPALTPELKDLVQRMRKSRNCLLHEIRVFDENTAKIEAQVLQTMIEEMYLEISKKYTVDVSNEILEMKDKIDEIMRIDIPLPDIDKYRRDLSQLRGKIKDEFRVEGQKELKNNRDFWTLTDPIAFISGRERLYIESVFTRIELVAHDLQANKDNVSIKYEDILKLLAYNQKIPDVLILEGPSGAGKTSLTKLLFSYFLKGLYLDGYDSPVCDINSFDLIFPFECSNSNITSYLSLIKAVLPKTSYAFKDDDILRSVSQLKMFIMIDAADDLNPESKKLLREIIEIHIPNSRGMLRLICTTRPQALKDLQKMLAGKTTAHVKITGISSDNQEVFLARLHDEMKRNGQSVQETEGLVNFHRRTKHHFGEHLKFPLVLNLVTYLWAADPDKINGVTTVATLYKSIHKLNEKRAHDNINKDPKVRDIKSLSEIEESTDKFLDVLYEESLVVVCLGVMIFPEKREKNLKKAADHLPLEKLCSAFINIERKWTVNGIGTQLTAPHKSLVEFYGANHVCDCITEKVQTDHKLKTVRGILEYNHSKLSIPLEMPKHQNLLVHTIGLLADQGESTLRRFDHEIIDLLNETGICDMDNWFHVLNETKCDEVVGKLIAEKLREEQLYSWTVTDRNIRSASALLKSITPGEIRLILEEDLTGNNDLLNLLNQISALDCKLRFYDQHSLNKCTETPECILPLLTRCKVEEFRGAVTNLEGFPGTLKWLWLAVLKDDPTEGGATATAPAAGVAPAGGVAPAAGGVAPAPDGTAGGGDMAVALDPGLSQMVQQFPQLQMLVLHISAGTLTEALTTMPDVGDAWLQLSDVTTRYLEWVTTTAQTLQPNRGFYWIAFPDCQLSLDELCALVSQLNDAGVTVRGWFGIPSDLFRKDWAKLSQALSNTWSNCRLHPCVSFK